MDQPTTSAEQSPHTIFDVIRDVVVNYVDFAQKYLLTSRPPVLLIVLWLIGMDAIAGAIETVNINTGAYPVDNWFHSWLFGMGAGLPAGLMRYWLVGSIFHFLVRMAGGHHPIYASRNVFVYSALPAAVVDLLLKAVQMIMYGNGYFAQQTPTAIDGMFSFIAMAAYGYSVFLCYIGMRRVLGTEKRKTFIALGAIAVAAILAMLALMPAMETP